MTETAEGKKSGGHAEPEKPPTEAEASSPAAKPLPATNGDGVPPAEAGDAREVAAADAADEGDEDEAPLSMRDVELDPVSLHDLELILAPGRAPPTLGAPPAPPPLRPVTAAGAATRPAEIPAPQGKRLPKAPVRRDSAPPPPPDSGLMDLRAMVQASETVLRPASVNFDDIMQLGSAGPIVKSDALLAGPDLARLSKQPEVAKVRPRPPLKSRPDAGEPTSSAAEPAPEEAIPEPTPSSRAKANKAARTASDTPPSSRGARRKKKKPSSLHADPEALFAFPADPPSQLGSEADREIDRPDAEPGREPALEPKAKPKAQAKASAPSETPRAEPPKSRALVYAVGAVVVVVVGYFVTRGDAAPEKPHAPTGTAAAAGALTSSQAAAPTPTPTPTPEATPSSAPSTSAEPPSSASARPIASPSGEVPRAAASGNASAPTAGAATTAPTTAATTAPTAPPKPTVEASGAGFDAGAASAALAAAAGQAAGCKQEGDPSGQARAQITFAPSGRVTSANINGPPFAGTATGGCIARTLKSARVPPFSGDPVTVSKTVTIR